MLKLMISLSLAVFATTAWGADMAARFPVKAPPVSQPTSVGMFYVGAFGGGGTSGERFDFGAILPGSGNVNAVGYQAGVKAGYAQWFGAIMLGLEVDAAYDFNRSQASLCGAVLSCESKGSWLFTQRAVIGLGMQGIGMTPYLTAGVAERRVQAEVVGVGSSSEWLIGATGGAGLRIPFGDRFAIDISYLYVHYNKTFSPGGGPLVDFKATGEHIARAGFNWAL